LKSFLFWGGLVATCGCGMEIGILMLVVSFFMEDS